MCLKIRYDLYVRCRVLCLSSLSFVQFNCAIEILRIFILYQLDLPISLYIFLVILLDFASYIEARLLKTYKFMIVAPCRIASFLLWMSFLSLLMICALQLVCLFSFSSLAFQFNFNYSVSFLMLLVNSTKLNLSFKNQP